MAGGGTRYRAGSLRSPSNCNVEAEEVSGSRRWAGGAASRGGMRRAAATLHHCQPSSHPPTHPPNNLTKVGTFPSTHLHHAHKAGLRPALAVKGGELRVLKSLADLNHAVSTEVEDGHRVACTGWEWGRQAAGSRLVGGCVRWRRRRRQRQRCTRERGRCGLLGGSAGGPALRQVPGGHQRIVLDCAHRVVALPHTPFELSDTQYPDPPN